MIYCQNIWFHADFKYINNIKKEVVLSYINKVKSRCGIGIPTTCGYQHCGEKTGFNVRSMFAQCYFALPVLNNILHIFLHGVFTILPVCLYWKEI